MATPPQVTSLNVELYGDLPAESRKVLEQIGRVLNPYLNDSVGALDRGLTFAENFKAQVREIEFTMPSDTSAVTYQNLWSNWGAPYSNVTYLKTADGEVVCTGLPKAPTPAPAVNATVWTFPDGYRPGETKIFRFMRSGGVEVSVEVGSNGEVKVGSITAGSNFPAEGLRFFAADRTPAPLGAPFPMAVSLDRSFPGTPRYAVVWDAYDVAAKKPVAGVSIAISPTSTPSGPGVLVTDVRGCVPNRKYRLTVLIFPE